MRLPSVSPPPIDLRTTFGPDLTSAPGPAWSIMDHAHRGRMRRRRSNLHKTNRCADEDSIVLVALRGLDRLGDRKAQLAQLDPERPAGDPEDPRRLELVTPGRLEHERQEMLVDLAMDVLVEILLAVFHPQAKERLDG